MKRYNERYNKLAILRFLAKPHSEEFLLITIGQIGLIHTPLFWFSKICSSMGNFHIEVEHQRNYF